ncbi:MAG: putative DNA binding domain-containing protein [Spirochaetaceae bacterium]|jgi:ATP-dependent DNA helicase RecG|nr:putative DNA binding domain-containing protein [Spirochaetaceae bacterium]
MLTREKLERLIADMESDRVERTISTDNTDKFSQAVCAFANDYPNHRQPGYLLIGVKDKTGDLSGLNVTDQLLQNLGALRSAGNILPIPALTVSRFDFGSFGQLAVVEVQPSDLPPVRYKGQVWIRVGPRKAVASEQEERILSEKRASLLTTFDTTPLREAGIADLSMRLFDEYRQQTISAEVIATNHRTTEEKLASLRCFDLKANVPTVAGILLFGNDPRFFLPGAYVQFLKFPGTAMTERPDDELAVSGDLRTVIETIRQKIVAHNTVALQQGEGFREKNVPDYPEWALREFFHNAVMHRNYQSTMPIRFYWFSDRIEIQNSGGLYGEVTRETLEKQNSYRNPVLAETMRSMDYVNRYGYGIQRARSMLRDNGNPAPEFEIDDKVFLVIIRRRPE